MALPSGLIQYARDGPTFRPVGPQDFRGWLAGLKFHLAKKNVPIKEMPDGTIIAKFGTETLDMSPEMQQENYQAYLDKFHARKAEAKKTAEEAAHA
jgi:hypothetical protein